MKRTRFDDAPCPIARTTDLIGDWWTPVVMRESFFGCRRFEQFQARLGLSRATLTQRLDRLVLEGLLERVPYQDNPPRDEYHLTAKGRAFWDVLAAMWRYGEDWLFTAEEGGPPVRLAFKDDGETHRPHVVDEKRMTHVDVRELRVRSARRT
jgi:DNA-binding HxlR family transcriptional regulator